MIPLNNGVLRLIIFFFLSLGALRPSLVLLFGDASPLSESDRPVTHGFLLQEFLAFLFHAHLQKRPDRFAAKTRILIYIYIIQYYLGFLTVASQQ